ncbi:hypothetical protein J0664_26020 (plasmid) [Rhizobium leguminosarum]|uniref:calcium-binding protein n=1 Tax=Rhizobium leguminosarum TaxID=384 RepID=UPI001A92FF0D|nr:calcium-binding protein [Rhizobium leguminosarum]MBY5558864.1 hypothetical protein [Rhizobium leguminosarum]QSW27015.1 hypothetical protein J0664_26020 [Rhizobium leguminosarum]
MSLAEVLSHIKVANPDDAGEIERIVTYFYESSPAKKGFAYQLFESLVVENRDLTFSRGAGGKMESTVHGYEITEYSKSFMENKVKISSNGVISEYTFAQALMHEIIHAVTGANDDGTPGADGIGNGGDYGMPANLTTPKYNYVGLTVALEQQIFAEAGIPNARASYHSTPYLNELENQLGVHMGESLTAGKEVGLVLLDDIAPTGHEIDTTDRGDDVLLIGMYGDDKITAGSGDDFLYGGTGEDEIVGGAGTDRIFGNAENDTLIGGTSEESDAVADYLTGGAGSDSFYVDNILGASQAFSYSSAIHDYQFNEDVRGTFDLIRDYTSGDSIFVTVEDATWLGLNDADFSAFALQSGGYSYGDKPIYTAATGEFSLSAIYDTYFEPILKQTITVLLFFEAELKTAIFGIETSLPTTIQGSSGADVLTGTSASDAMFGGDGDDSLGGGDASDELNGGRGDDSLSGGRGSDTYSYAKGDGNDLISDVADNASKDFLRLSDLDFRDLTITKTSGDLILTVNDTGETITLKNQYNSAGEASGIEFIQFGGGGALKLEHAVDTNWITGSSGADSLQGASGRDYMIAGEGADQISGGAGSDIYIYRNGDGSDTIDDGSDSQQAPDVLQLIDIWSFQVTLARDGDDLQVITANGDTITVRDQFRSDSLYSGIERIEFADGSALGLTDIMAMFPNVTDGTDDDDTLVGTNRNDLMKGFDGDDQFDGRLGDDVLDGGLGNDFLNGGEGSDVYHYAAGDGSDTIADVAINVGEADVLRFSDLNIGDLTFSRSGEDLFITVNSTGQVITVETQYYNAGQGWALERLEFADGTSLQLDHLPDTNWIYGTAASETIDGSWGKDYITAGQGDDVINGSAGGDVYIYASGDGNDLINDEVGFTDAVDVLRFTDLNASDLSLARHGDDLELTNVATGDVVTLKGQMFEDPGDWGVDKIEFADGASWDRDFILQNGYDADDTVTVQGTSGDDVLNGTSAHDLLWGGQGDDFLLGGYGGDTYLYSVGEGSDYIDDEANSPYQLDVLKFTDLNEEDISAVRDGVNLKLTVLSTGDTITLDEQFYSSTQYWGIERIEFADGSFWDRGDILRIEESGTNLAGSQLVQSTQSNATNDDGQLYENVIQFPEAGLEVNVTNRDLLASASNQTGSTSAASDIASAEIISLSDFMSAQDHMNTATDLWYEPEPIGAVI